MRTHRFAWALAVVAAVGLIGVSTREAEASGTGKVHAQLAGHSVYVGPSGLRLGYGYGYGYGSPYRYGHGHSSYYRGHYDWHDTSHYDWHPGYLQRHGHHFHYMPGHNDFHNDGHYDYHHRGHHHHGH